jgi:hypothetical protein
MPRKKVIAAMDLNDFLPNLLLKRGKATKKIKVFNRDNFVLP